MRKDGIEIKFKYYFLLDKKVINTKIFDIEDIEDINFNTILFMNIEIKKENFERMELYREQYTGLKDKNDVEIYEYMEIDNTYEVSFLNGSYVLTNISNGDIMLLSNYMENNNGQVAITKEYTKI